MKGEVERKLELASKRYADLSLLRVAIVAIPYAGGPIDMLRSSKASKVAERRIDDFIKQMTAEMKTADASKIDRAFLDSEEFLDVIMKAFESSAKTRSDKKRQLFARILAARIEQDDLACHSPEDYLSVITQLSESEILIAQKIYEVIVSKPRPIGGTQFVGATVGLLEQLHQGKEIPLADYDYVLLRLQRVGLLKEQTGAFAGYSGGAYHLTSAFMNLMRTLEKGVT